MHVKVFFYHLGSEASVRHLQLQRRNDSVCICRFASRITELILFSFFFFFPPGVVAVSDQRGPAADPQGLALGASGGGALCGAGGLLTQQVALHSSDRLLSVSFPCSET